MRKVIAIVLGILLLAGIGMAEQVTPNADLLTKSADGAYEVIVSGWGDQVNMINGVAAIGSIGSKMAIIIGSVGSDPYAGTG